MELSDEEEEEEKEKEKVASNKEENESKLIQIKNEVQNLDGCTTWSGNCRSHFLPIICWKKELELLLILLKSFGMKDVKAVVGAYPCDGDMTQKTRQHSLLIRQRNSNRRRKWGWVETGPCASSSCILWNLWRWNI